MKEIETANKLLVNNVPKLTVQLFGMWLEDQDWEIGVGYSVFPTYTEGLYTIAINTVYKNAWVTKVYPRLVEYFDGYQLISPVKIA